MKSDIDIKELWRKQAVPFADCSGLFKEVNHFKRKKVLELIVLNAVFMDDHLLCCVCLDIL